MNVTRDIILDLLPLYLSNEASEDTRALVKTYLDQDKQLAQIVKEKPDELLFSKTPVPLPKEHELKTIERTKTMLKLQSVLLAVAIFFTLAPMAGYDVGEHRWSMLGDFPAGAITCALLATLTWIVYFAMSRKLRTTGI